mgnify:CR=1 FL=1
MFVKRNISFDMQGFFDVVEFVFFETGKSADSADKINAVIFIADVNIKEFFEHSDVVAVAKNERLTLWGLGAMDEREQFFKIA